MFVYLKKVACLIGLFAFALIGETVEINSENYDIYKGDVNADGYSDFYFHPKRKFLILHGEIAVPIAYSNPQGFVMYGSLANGKHHYGNPQSFELSGSALQAKLSASSLKLAVINIDFSSWFDTPSGVFITRLYAGDTIINLSSTASAPLPTLVSTSHRTVVFIHTDLLGSPAAETNQQGN